MEWQAHAVELSQNRHQRQAAIVVRQNRKLVWAQIDPLARIHRRRQQIETTVVLNLTTIKPSFAQISTAAVVGHINVEPHA